MRINAWVALPLIAMAASDVAAQQGAGDASAQDDFLTELLDSGSGGYAATAPAEASYSDTIPVTGLAQESGSTTVPERRNRPGVGIEEIVVTAQRRDENVSDVPIAISAFSGDTLNTLGINETRDLAKLVPGFSASESGGNTPIYTLRGVGFNDTTYTATSTVGVYVDEVSLPYSIMSKGSALDLERVEVLKGPQGILYGRNTTGGAINLIARKPTEEFEAGAQASYGRFMISEVEAYVSGKLIGDLNGRLAVKDTRSGEGWQYSNTRPDDRLGEQDKQAFRASLEWLATETLELRLVGEGWWDRSEPQARQAIEIRQQNGVDPTGQLFLPPQAREYPVVPVDADPRVADWPTTFPWRLNDRFLSAALRADWQLDEDTRFTTIANQMRVESNDTLLPSSGFNFNSFEEILNARIETSSLELRLAGIAGESATLDWLIGANASKDRGRERHEQIADFQSALFSDPITGRSVLTNRLDVRGHSDVRQIAGFANVNWHFTDAWTLTLGGRYTQQTQGYVGCAATSENADYDLISSVFTALSAANAAQWLLTTGQPGVVSVVQTGECFTVGPDGSTEAFAETLDEDNLALRIALDWKPADETLYYASVSRGYKAGGYPVLGASSKAQYAAVTQEEVLAFEVGGKFTLMDRQLRTNLAGYFYLYNDKQLLTKTRDPLFGPLPILQNAPKSQVHGLEIDLQYAPHALPGLFVALSGAYTHTEIRQFEGLDSGGRPYDFAGRPFNFAPQYQGTVLINYAHPLTRTMDLMFGADYRHSGSTSSSLDDDPIFRHPATGVVGARLGLQGQQWSIAAFGRNLTDELVPVTILAFGDSVNRFVELPRTYGLSISYDW